MIKGKITSLLAITMLAFSLMNCATQHSSETKENFQLQGIKVNFPEPDFDRNTDEILNEYKEKYDAEGVRISRPFDFSTTGDSSCWIRVDFLNPELHEGTSESFGKEVALATYDHLRNDEGFPKIEIGITNRKGFILTFSTSQNYFFYRDSLKLEQK